MLNDYVHKRTPDVLIGFECPGWFMT